MLINRAIPQDPICRFPAFWGPNWDWIPDQDHGSNILICMQAMLMQSKGDSLLLFPAWPKDWDVEFKIHAPHITTVTGNFEKGKIKSLQINPENRKNDLIVWNTN